MQLLFCKSKSWKTIGIAALIGIIGACVSAAHADDASLAIQVAKAIQSDEKGEKFFTTEQGLVDFLVATLHADRHKAAETAKHMLNDDIHGNRYYYLPQGGGPETLSGLLKPLIAPK